MGNWVVPDIKRKIYRPSYKDNSKKPQPSSPDKAELFLTEAK